MESGKVLLGVLAGVATGALLGILFAPDKGSKTRKKIVSKGSDYADAIKEQVEELVETITEKYESMMDDTDKVVSKVKEGHEVIKKELKHLNS